MHCESSGIMECILSYPEPDFLHPVLRHGLDIIGTQLIHLLLAREHVDLVHRYAERRVEPRLVAEPEQQEGWDGDVRGEETLDVPAVRGEELEAVGEGQEDHDAQHEPG